MASKHEFGFAFEFRKGHKQVISDIQDAFDDAKSAIQSRIERAYGSRWVKSDIFASEGDIFRNKAEVDASGRHPTTGANEIAQQLKSIVRLRWKEIQENQEAYTTTVEPNAPPSRFQRHYKIPNAGQPAFHNGRPIEHPTEFGLMTGMMLEEIQNAYVEGGNEYYRFGNLMVSDARSFHLSSFPSMYAVFSQWYAEKDLYGGSDSIYEFFMEDIPAIETQQIIGRKMKKFAEENIRDVFYDELKQISVQV